jgi:hypothetical protein
VRRSRQWQIIPPFSCCFASTLEGFSLSGARISPVFMRAVVIPVLLFISQNCRALLHLSICAL